MSRKIASQIYVAYAARRPYRTFSTGEDGQEGSSCTAMILGPQETRTLRQTSRCLWQLRLMNNEFLLFGFNSFQLLVSHTSTAPGQPARPSSPTHRERINTENREIAKRPLDPQHYLWHSILLLHVYKVTDHLVDLVNVAVEVGSPDYLTALQGSYTMTSRIPSPSRTFHKQQKYVVYDEVTLYSTSFHWRWGQAKL